MTCCDALYNGLVCRMRSLSTGITSPSLAPLFPSFSCKLPFLLPPFLTPYLLSLHPSVTHYHSLTHTHFHILLILLSLQNRRPKGPAGNNGNSVAYDSDDEDDDDSSPSRCKPEELKKTHYTHREFDEVTLNPRWKDSSGKAGGCQFYLPLPCPRRVLLSEASLHVPLTTESISDFSFKNGSSSSSSSSSSSNVGEGQTNNNSSVGDDRAVQEREREREGYHGRACRCLLDHWSQGVIVIRVVDGERFNEEIFMGEVMCQDLKYYHDCRLLSSTVLYING